MESPRHPPSDNRSQNSKEVDEHEVCPSDPREKCSQQESITESKIQVYPGALALTLIIISLALPFFLVALDRTIIGTAM